MMVTDIEGLRGRYKELLRASVERIVEKLSGSVEKISIFGSYARKKSDLFTDLDVLVVMRTEKPFMERLKEIFSLLTLPVDADILCYTPEEYERMKSRGFLKTALENEVVLYEKRRS